MLTQYSFLLLAFCLTMTAAMRPFLTIYIVCHLAYFESITGFVLPDIMSFLATVPGLICLGILALLEIISDKRFSIITTILTSVRPVATIIAPLAVMRFPSPITNIIAAVVIGLAVGMPFLRLFSSLVVPAKVHNADARIQDSQSQERAARISNTPLLSLGQDIICALLAYFAFQCANIIVLVLIAAVFALVMKHQQRRDQVGQPTKPQKIKPSKDVKLPNFPANMLSDGTKTKAPSAAIPAPDLAEQKKKNEESGYGYLN